MRALAALLALAAFFSGTHRATAQLDISMTLERQNYVSLESIEATVTVKNTVGKDVVLGGPNGTTWLNFQIFDTTGTPASTIKPVPAAPLVLRAGQSLQRKFELNRYYYLSESGTYIVRAVAYFPDLEKYNQSRPKRFNVQQPRSPKFQEVFAVPGEAGYRRYQVFTLTDTTKTYVCLSVVDENTQMVLSRTTLGSVMMEKEIQPAIDSQQHLHLIYLGTPTLYVYQQIDALGNVTDLKYYKLSAGQPKLIKQPDGQVAILGGQVFDPSQQPEDDGFRRLSDRPAGLAN